MNKSCSIQECGKPVKARGWCTKHWKRWYVYGDPLKITQRERGTGTISQHGYMEIVIEGRRIFEHRYIMEQHLGRPLRAGEIVHHRDGEKLNNDLSNLELMTQSEHVRLHPEMKSRPRYGPEGKRCAFCDVVKPLDQFTFRPSGPIRSYCKPCSRTYSKIANERRKEQVCAI